tara:strand:- start:429 stop:965 length:537 start_codon:yes stop_codon:yes gene_type:complete
MLLSPCGHVRVSADHPPTSRRPAADQPLRVTISLSDVQAPAGAALVVREASSVVAGVEGQRQRDLRSLLRRELLLLLAGIDTTWSAIGQGLWHLARNPDDLARLVAVVEDPDDMLWLTFAEQVLVTFPSANHDPLASEDPHEFRTDRAENRYVAFGLRVRCCRGSNLARLEMHIAIRR